MTGVRPINMPRCSPQARAALAARGDEVARTFTVTVHEGPSMLPKWHASVTAGIGIWEKTYAARSRRRLMRKVMRDVGSSMACGHAGGPEFTVRVERR